MRIAVIGAGVSGLGAAHLLARAHDVSVFERSGTRGRARPHGAPRRPRARHRLHRPQRAQLPAPDAAVPRARRPGTTRRDVVLGELRRVRPRMVGQAPVRAAPARGRPALSLASSPRSCAGFAPRGARSTRPTTRSGRSRSTSTERGYSQRFRTHYLVPLTSALWSTAPERALEFPAAYAIRFFEHHRMLGFGRHRWRTVTGGAESVRASACSTGSAAACTLGLGVRTVRRGPDGVELRTDDDATRRFDAVVVATHGDEALRAARRPERRRGAGARRLALDAERGRAPHRTRASCLARRPRARRGTTS